MKFRHHLKILILAENYPHPSHPETQAFIHTRSLFYRQKGLDFKVRSFRAQDDYVLDGIEVLSKDPDEEIDLCIVHAANLRNHIAFLIKHRKKIKTVLFIFHGYEALHTWKRSGLPSHKSLKNLSRFMAQLLYDFIKLPLLKVSLSFLKNRLKCHFVFVSESLLNEISYEMNCDKKFFNPIIINNPINPIFYSSTYDIKEKWADFICVRPFDDTKYGVDIFIQMARQNPQRTFHLYGKGSSLEKMNLPSNLKVEKKFFKASEFPELLNHYSSGVLPTRWDSQGILACEFATYGIPLLTSNLPICKEMLGKYKHVGFFENSRIVNVEQLIKSISTEKSPKDPKFLYEKTTLKEVELINSIISRDF